MLTILLAVQKWRPYLLGRKFIIRTDQRSLKFLLDQRFRQESQHPWLLKLSGFDYVVEYKKGVKNKVADALSRRNENEVEEVKTYSCRATSVVEPKWLTEVRDMVAHSPFFVGIHKKYEEGSLSPTKYKKIEGVWFYKGRVLIDPNSTLCSTIFHDHHEAQGGGHSGYNRTLRRIKLSFWWPGLKNFILRAIKEYVVCQRNKGENVAPPGLLSPLPLPERVWEEISMDFVDGLPLSQGKSTILVVVDRYSKFTYFVAIQHPYIASKIAQVFFEEVFRLYGMPKAIVSDRDPIFLSTFWSELFKLQGTQLNLSSAYHPQSDGQTERVNQSLECYLRCFCSLKPSERQKWIPWAMFWHNTTWKSATGFTPYEIVYGRPPPTLLQYIPKTARV